MCLDIIYQCHIWTLNFIWCGGSTVWHCVWLLDLIVHVTWMCTSRDIITEITHTWYTWHFSTHLWDHILLSTNVSVLFLKQCILYIHCWYILALIRYTSVDYSTWIKLRLKKQIQKTPKTHTSSVSLNLMVGQFCGFI